MLIWFALHGSMLLHACRYQRPFTHDLGLKEKKRPGPDLVFVLVPLLMRILRKCYSLMHIIACSMHSKTSWQSPHALHDMPDNVHRWYTQAHHLPWRPIPYMQPARWSGYAMRIFAGGLGLILCFKGLAHGPVIRQRIDKLLPTSSVSVTPRGIETGVCACFSRVFVFYAYACVYERGRVNKWVGMCMCLCFVVIASEPPYLMWKKKNRVIL